MVVRHHQLYVSMLWYLKGVNIQVTYRTTCTNKPWREPYRSLVYPGLVDMLEEVGLCSIQYCILVRNGTITKYIINQPIFRVYKGGEGGEESVGPDLTIYGERNQ